MPETPESTAYQIDSASDVPSTAGCPDEWGHIVQTLKYTGDMLCIDVEKLKENRYLLFCTNRQPFLPAWRRSPRIGKPPETTEAGGSGITCGFAISMWFYNFRSIPLGNFRLLWEAEQTRTTPDVPKIDITENGDPPRDNRMKNKDPPLQNNEIC